MIDVKTIGRDFVLTHCDVDVDFFEAAWEIVTGFDLVPDASATPLRYLGVRLGIAGAERSPAVLAIVLLVQAERRAAGRGEGPPDFVSALEQLVPTVVVPDDFVRALIEHVKRATGGRVQEVSPPRAAHAYARMWLADTGHEGLERSEQEVADIRRDSIRFELLVIKGKTSTEVLVGGKPAPKPPGRKAYQIVSYVLKNKGSGGTAWNIAQHVFEGHNDLGFALRTRDADMVSRLSRRIVRRIADVNSYLERLRELKLNTRLEADHLDEYRLIPSVSFCLVEETVFEQEY